ncbi:sensor histidine kinase [Streptomyces viridosporus]|uniref:sensor histidine kinase n=1 Tax=Streptomyces viridosporus TaxID=67581 RepID=UPI00117C8019|nr:ATP-binding protein [Streptomyces viridosporus]
MSLGSGMQRARSFMILATGLYRVSHLGVGVLAVVQHQRDSVLSWLGLTVALGSSLFVFGTARSRRRFGTRPPLVDLVLVGCALPFAVYAGGADRPSDLAWSMLLGGSASAVCAVAFGRGAAVAGAVAALTATHTAGYGMAGAEIAVIAAHLNALVSSAVLARVFWWYLRRQGRLLDAATERAIVSEAARARYAERMAHHRALHDTVLATLTAIANGRADADSRAVRERCGREAAYLRRLVQQHAEEDAAPGTAAAVEHAVRSAESLGLRVTAQYGGLAEIPPHAAAALGSAVTEALNNVLRHAGTGRAYVTVTGDGDGVVVTVVDRGTGFDPRAVDEGLGLRSSIGARMREAGGAAEVDSAPGEGTRVALRWPA